MVLMGCLLLLSVHLPSLDQLTCHTPQGLLCGAVVPQDTGSQQVKSGKEGEIFAVFLAKAVSASPPLKGGITGALIQNSLWLKGRGKPSAVGEGIKAFSEVQL